MLLVKANYCLFSYSVFLVLEINFETETELDFGLWSTKLGGTVPAPIDNGPGPGWNYRETAVFTFCRNEVLGLKFVFFPARARSAQAR